MNATRKPPVIGGRNLTKRYPGVLALDNVDGAVRGGVILGLVGKNGAGKSTLLKIYAGAVQPDEGKVFVDGEEVQLHTPHDATKRGLAFVHQELADVPNLSVAENIELGLGYPKHAGVLVNRGALRRKTRDVLKRLKVDIDPSTPVGSLSLAERRLVMIARGIAANARLLVLDEPTASLTEDEIEHLHDVLRSLRDSDVAIIYVSHRLDEILSLTDYIGVMRDGKLVFNAPTKDVDDVQADRGDHRIARSGPRAAKGTQPGCRRRRAHAGREPDDPRRGGPTPASSCARVTCLALPV